MKELTEFRQLLKDYLIALVVALVFLVPSTTVGFVLFFGDVGTDGIQSAEGTREHLQEYTKFYVQSLYNVKLLDEYGAENSIGMSMLSGLAYLVSITFAGLSAFLLIALTGCGIPQIAEGTWNLPKNLRARDSQRTALDTYLKESNYGSEDPGKIHLIKALRSYSSKPELVWLRCFEPGVPSVAAQLETDNALNDFLSHLKSQSKGYDHWKPKSYDNWICQATISRVRDSLKR